MPRTCGLCRDPKKGARCATLRVAGQSFRDIARRVGSNKDSVKNHLLFCSPAVAQLARVTEVHQAATDETVHQEIRRLKADAQRLAEKAESQHDYRGALAAVRLLTDVTLRLEELTATRSDHAEPCVISFSFTDPPRLLSQGRGAAIAASVEGAQEAQDAIAEAPAENVGTEAPEPPPAPMLPPFRGVLRTFGASEVWRNDGGDDV